ncbi:Ig-like domain-containing protein [Mesobacillus jeotgali]|uniref:Ig-like domain-containing protein n=1 Tax=Mesobacillus jeotgali TaxID=129985 RepID=UPI00131599E6|nr:Ig-like domain-containing protein [Mesobacillus jeotgali]
MGAYRNIFSLLLVLSLVLGSVYPYANNVVEAVNYTRVTEIPDKRTENTWTFRNTNLSETIDVFPLPVFEKDSSGRFVQKDMNGQNGPLTFVSSSQGDANFSNDLLLKLGSDEEGSYRTYLDFGSSLPNLENKLIVDAKLQLVEYGNTKQPGYYDPAHRDGTFAVHNILENWDANTITWNTQPTISEQPVAVETDMKLVDSARFAWDITKLVQEWYKDPSASHGIALKANDENLHGTLRSFVKIDQKISYIPVLQITYNNPDLYPSGRGYNFGENSGKGRIDLQWYSVSGAKGYKVLIFNGKEYEEIDVGNQTTWTSLGKKIWPTEEQIHQGEYKLRLDGSGGDFTDKPAEVYANAGSTDRNPFVYYFKIQAYNDNGSILTNEVGVGIPDGTAPSEPENLQVKELASDFMISWNASVDDRSEISSYQVTLESLNGYGYITRSTSNTEIKIDEENLVYGGRYKISIRAVDANGNKSAAAMIQAEPRSLRASQIHGYTIPSYPLEVTSTPSLKLTVENTGYDDWTADKGYEVRVEGISVYELLGAPLDVKSGEVKELEVKLMGPLTIGETPIKLGIFHRDHGWVGSTVNRSMTFMDTTAPELILESPVNYDTLYGDVLIKGIISDYQVEEYTISYGASSDPLEWKVLENVSNQDGTFSFNWDTRGIRGGEYSLKVDAVDSTGNEKSIKRKVYINLPPMTPLVSQVTDKATTVSGTAKAGTNIKVLKGGALLGSASTGTNGVFSVKIPVAQSAGTVLQVTSTDDYGNVSLPRSVTVIDKTPPPAPKVNSVGDNMTTVTGSGEKSATIKVWKGSSVIGSSAVKADGTYVVSIAKQPAGMTLLVTATDKALNVSATTKITVVDKTPPVAPKVNVLGNNSTTVTGTAEKYAVIKIKKGSTVIATATVKADGKFSAAISKQNAGTVLSVTATDKAGNVSSTIKTTVLDKIAPAVPTVNTVYYYHTSVKGKAEAYSYITVKKGSTVIGTVKANSKGYFTVKIKKQKRGTKLYVTAKDKAGNNSKARIVTIK